MKELEEKDRYAIMRDVCGEWVMDKLLDHANYTKGGRRNKTAVKKALIDAANVKELNRRLTKALGNDTYLDVLYGRLRETLQNE